MIFCLFFFKQKTAYEMRISDWSSDVCSSDLAYNAALACDSVSAFGGIIALNRPLDGATARAISAIFTEVVIAPDADAEARAIFAAKKNLRLLLTGDLPDPTRGGLMMKTIAGGMLVQSSHNGRVPDSALKGVPKRPPTSERRRGG